MSHGDIGIWVLELKKRGIDRFKFRDLPKDLQVNGMTRKAKGLGIIRRVEKMVGYSVWEFEKRERMK